MQIATGGYEVLNTEAGQIFTDLGVIVAIPALYLATKIVKDRPFSSYASSRGGWNFKLYFKALLIPFILFIIIEAIDVVFRGSNGTNHFTIPFFKSQQKSFDIIRQIATDTSIPNNISNNSSNVSVCI